MEALYPFITMISMAGFGWLGWSMATSRSRNPALWTALGAIFPPLLLILVLLKPLEDAAAEVPKAGDGRS
jgi:uncharacterized protein (DUF983 family)